MPYDEPDEADPMLLVGVELPADAASAEEACGVLADEYARMGLGEERLMELFRSPFYTGPHRIFRSLGEERVRVIVRENVGVWGRVSFRDRDVDPESGVIPLPVLNDRPSASGRRLDHA